MLFPDPQPLVERLGREFFRQAPERPGVYLMRAADHTVLYVGKARNLRRRLASYRVANPDRLPRRHLRMLRAVVRIEVQECADESSALAREAQLLLSLKPRFNRAGTWPSPTRFLAWRATANGLELALTASPANSFDVHGPLRGGSDFLLPALGRLFWGALHPGLGIAAMPAGWFRSRFRPRRVVASAPDPARQLPPELRHSQIPPQFSSSPSSVGALFDYDDADADAPPRFIARAVVPRRDAPMASLDDCAARLSDLCAGDVEKFVRWISDRPSVHRFELALRDADLETVTHLAKTRPESAPPSATSPGAGPPEPGAGAEDLTPRRRI